MVRECKIKELIQKKNIYDLKIVLYHTRKYVFGHILDIGR